MKLLKQNISDHVIIEEMIDETHGKRDWLTSPVTSCLPSGEKASEVIVFLEVLKM